MTEKSKFLTTIFFTCFLSVAIPAFSHSVSSAPYPFERAEMYRDYYAEVSDIEIAEMRFILKSLAQKSLLSLWSYEDDLKKAGDNIDHIHPLVFLTCIFTCDEFIVYINNIKDRGSWVWEEFVSGFERSLDEEADKDNLKEEFFQDFLAKIGVNPSLVKKKIQKRDWEAFIKILIMQVKRQGEPGKYDQ